MMFKQPSIKDLQIAVTIIHPIAILCTAFRIGYRWYRRRFWWDDALAGFSMLFDIVFFVAIWIRTEDKLAHVRIVTYWIVSLGFTFVLWSARLSMLLSIIRIIPPPYPLRRLAYGTVGLFGAIWIGLVAQKSYKCGLADTAWMKMGAWTQCRLGKRVAITELCTDFIGDAILVFMPLQLLWNTSHLPPGHRTLLFTIFSGSMVTTIVSVPHAVFVMGEEGEIEGLTAHVEAGVSLIVANLLVTTTFLYRLLKIKLDRSWDDEYTAPTISIVNNASSYPRQRDFVSRSTFPDSFDLRFIGRESRSYGRRGAGSGGGSRGGRGGKARWSGAAGEEEEMQTDSGLFSLGSAGGTSVVGLGKERKRESEVMSGSTSFDPGGGDEEGYGDAKPLTGEGS